MSTKYHQGPLNDGVWSPARPGMFCTARSDGVLDVWDLFVKQTDPLLTMQVTPCALQCLAIEQGARLIAAGSLDGSTTLFQLCDSLAVPSPNEKLAVQQMLERESQRQRPCACASDTSAESGTSRTVSMANQRISVIRCQALSRRQA